MRGHEPYDYEQFFAELVKGVRVNREYDIMNHSCLVEVKSCSIRNTGGRTGRFGRFHIQANNHVDLRLESIADNKIPLYGFIVKVVDGKSMCVIRPWDFVEDLMTYRNKHEYLQWYKVFGLPNAIVRKM